MELKEVFEANDRVLEGIQTDMEGVQKGQTPTATMVYCSDSRVHPQNFIGTDAFNKIFSIENAGNRVDHDIASAGYAILHLKTPYLFIVGHTACGACTGAFSDHREEEETLKNYLDEIEGLISGDVKAKAASLEENTRIDFLTQAHVDVQVAKLKEKYGTQMETNGIKVYGLMFDLRGSYGGKKGQLYLVNVDGKTDVDEIRADVPGLEAKVKRL